MQLYGYQKQWHHGVVCRLVKEAIQLIKNINAKLVFADRAYDTNGILSYLNQPKRNRLYQRDYKCLKKRDNSFIVKFIAPVISLKILSLL